MASIYTLTGTEWLIFAIPLAVVVIIVLDIWSSFSARLLVFFGVRGQREDVIALLAVVTVLVMLGVAMRLGSFTTFFGLVNYSDPEFARQRIGVIHSWMKFMTVTSATGALISPWVAYRRRRPFIRWILYGGLLGWGGILYLALISREAANQE